MKPELGDIVIYRNRDGVDMPGIVTGIASRRDSYLHLKLFPPPGAAADMLDPHWGAGPDKPHLMLDPKDPDGIERQTWRWPEHAKLEGERFEDLADAVSRHIGRGVRTRLQGSNDARA